MPLCIIVIHKFISLIFVYLLLCFIFVIIDFLLVIYNVQSSSTTKLHHKERIVKLLLFYNISIVCFLLINVFFFLRIGIIYKSDERKK